jgi:hypothetical protein
MQCSIGAVKEIRKTLAEETKKVRDLGGVVTASGESTALTEALLRMAMSNMSDPESVFNAISYRDAQTKSGFYAEIRKQLSEEITLYNDRNQPVDMFMVDGFIDDKNPDLITLVVADRINPSKTQRIEFNLSEDTGTALFTGEQYSFPGMANLVHKAQTQYKQSLMSKYTGKVEYDNQGHSELNGVLGRMIEAGTYLGSNGNVDPESLIGFEQIRDYEHGNIDTMREMMNKLHVLGGEKAEAGQLDYYNQLLDSFHPSFFNKMKLFVKRNGVEAQGQVQLEDEIITITVAPEENVVDGMTEAEVYMHEVVHTMVAWALRQSYPGLDRVRRQLTELMAKAKEQIRWQDLLPVDESVANERQIERAKQFQRNMFTGKNAIDEFIAYGLTNPRVIELLSNMTTGEGKKERKTLFEKLVGLFTDTMDMVLGRFAFKDNDVSMYKKLHELTFNLAEVNNKHRSVLEEMNPLGKLMDSFQDMDSYLGRKLVNLKEKVKQRDARIDVPDDNASVYENAKFVLKLTLSAMTNPVYRGMVGLWASRMGMAPDGTVREIVATFFDKDQSTKTAEKISLLSSKKDAIRNSTVAAVSRSLRKAFRVPLKKEEDHALTDVLLDTNASSLLYKRGQLAAYSKQDFKRLLTDAQYRKERIGRAKAAIRSEIGSQDDSRTNWTIAQAVGLGYFMATHQAHSAQVLNSYSISRGFGLNTRYTENKHVENLVSELAALNALEYTNTTNLTTVAGLLENEWKAVKKIADTYESYKQSSETNLFSSVKAHKLEGHTKELFDDTIDVQTAPLSERATLEANGYKLIKEFKGADGVGSSVPLGMFVTNSWGRPERQKGIVNIGTNHTRGTTLRETKRIENPELAEALFTRDFARVAQTSMAIHESMQRGEFDPSTARKGLVPVYNAAGKVTDFRYMMSKEEKIKHFKQNRKATDILAKSVGSIEDQVRGHKINMVALNALKEDMTNNWVEGELGLDNYTEYALIGPESRDPKMREMFYALPDPIKEFVLSRADKTIAVRKKHMLMYFGGHHLQLSGYPLVKHLPAAIKHVINMIEGIWNELIKVSKSSTLIKIPKIIYDNVVSNLLYIIFTGDLNIKQVVTDHVDAARDLDRYIKDRGRLSELEQEVKVDKEALRRVRNGAVLSNKIHEKTIEIERIKSAMYQNPAHVLFEAGMYQTHIIDVAGSVLDDSNRLVEYGNRVLERLPKPLQTAFHYTYLTQNTGYFKVMQEVLQRSDMIARMVDNKRQIRLEDRMIAGDKRLPQWWLDEKGSDYPEKKVLDSGERVEFRKKAFALRMESLANNYINYTIPNGAFEEHLNRLGVLQFTKYLKRIQTVIINSSMTNPVKTALLVAMTATVWDASHIQDSSAFYRLMYGNSAVFGVVPAYSPMHHIANVFEPALFRDDFLGRFL